MSGLPIRSAIDITVARTVLRKRLAGQSWTPVFKAQVAAALTTIGEISIMEHAGGMVNISTTTRGPNRGVELRGTLNYSQTLEDTMAEIKAKLATITDEIELHHQGKLFSVIVRIWQKNQ
jgi:hypothetical protein